MRKLRDLVAAVVEDQRAPVGVLALARVGVLVEVGAVEVAEAVASRGKWAGTQSRITPMPALVAARRRRHMKSCGVP